MGERTPFVVERPWLWRVVILVAVLLAVLVRPPAAGAVSSTVVISQFQVAGATAADEFLELHNVGDTPYDLNGHRLVYRSAAGTSDAATPAVIWTTSTLIPAGGYYLIAAAPAGSPPQGYAGTQEPDSTYSHSGTGALAAAGGGFAIRNGPANTGPIVDSVGYGTATNAFVETAVAPVPAAGSSQSRRDGGCQDSDDNSADFAIQAPAAPRNRLSPVQLCGQPGGATSTPTPGASPTPTRTPSPTPTGTATPPPIVARIHDIQTAGHRSALEGAGVAGVAGVVTVMRSNGFFMQDPQPDADDRTSEAIFVFTSSSPAVAVGDAVTVGGTVTEFRAGCSPTCSTTDSAYSNLTITEITQPQVAIVSGDNPLPTPVVVGPGGRRPPTTVIEDDAAVDVETGALFDPASDGLDFYESLEGMRVQIDDAVAVGPRQDFSGGVSEVVVLAGDGAGAGRRTPRGGIVVSADDFNPERIIVSAPTAQTSAVDVGDRFAGATVGVMDYSFGNFKLAVAGPFTATSGGLARETTAPAVAGQLAIATFNVENLDPGDGTPKFDTLADLIVRNLQSPDILALEEVQDNSGPANNAVVAADVTYATLIEAIRAAGGPTYQVRQIDPANNQDGGEPGGNIRQGFLFRTDRGLAFVDRPGGNATTATSVVAGPSGPQLTLSPGRLDPSNSAFANSRKPLVGEFAFNGQRLFVVANHFNSKGGDQPLFGRFQPPTRSSEAQRTRQAEVVASFVSGLLAADASANVVVLGDLNDFEFSPTLAILKATGLVDLMETLPPGERYTYVFDGNSQDLDHTLVSPHLVAVAAPVYDVVHVNAEFTVQASDHDPQVVRLTLPATGAATPTPSPASSPTPTATATATVTPPATPTVTHTPTATAIPGRVTVSGLALLDTEAGTGTAIFTLVRDDRGRLTGQLLFADRRQGIVLTSREMTSLSLEGATATFGGTGRCLDLHRAAVGPQVRQMTDDQVLEGAGQLALGREVDLSGRDCTFTARATDAGVRGDGDVFVVDIGDLGVGGGPVRRGDVRITMGR